MIKHLKIILVVLFTVCCNLTSFSQIVYYEDIFQGGVTGGGFSTGMGVGSGTLQLHIEANSSIRKALIFVYSTGKNTSENIFINNFKFNFNEQNRITSFIQKNEQFSPLYLHCIDITSEISTMNTDVFNITIPAQSNLPEFGVFAPYLLILYENNSLPLVNSYGIINNQKLFGYESYFINSLNSINSNFPVGFSIYSDRSEYGPPIEPTHKQVFFNNNLLGTIGGTDNVNSLWGFAGVKGNFYYQNNQLYGLDDDTPDAIMSGTDGLADVSSYLPNNSTSCSWEVIHTNYPNQPSNLTHINLAYFLTYTSPCTPFPVSVPSDTTACFKSPLQLNTTGGQRYEWKSPGGSTNNPAPGLSCSDCPNPIFSADSSMFYTVRIWNNDSCSIVRPLKITVLPQPKSATFTTTNTECGTSAGSITATGVGGALSALNAISENGDTLAVSGNKLSNLSAGKYTLFYTDTNGCHSKDTLLTIQSVNNTVANFTVTPSAGGAPLSVTVTNTSQNATNYSWSLNGEPQNNPFNGFLADTSGVYTVQLIAWKNDIMCADTAYMNVLVYDSLITTIPNIFTPNDDHINDIFSVTVNIPVHCELLIFNRWGNEVQHFSGMLNTGANALWDGNSNGKNVIDGTYFYKMVFKLDETTTNCEIIDCSVEEQGFVTVRR